MSDPRELLRRVCASDENCLSSLMAATPECERTEALDRRVRALVRLAALVMVGAPTNSLRSEVERALGNGATDAAVAQTLLTTARYAGLAQLVSAAPRIGLALGFDMDFECLDEP